MSEPPAEPEYPPPTPYHGGDPTPAVPPPAPTPPRAPSARAPDYQADLPASKTAAGWALGLALVGCVPCLWVVALVLGVKVLRRGRDGRDHGSGLAIAAICVAAVIGFVQLGFVVISLADGGEESTVDPPRPPPTQILPKDLAVSQCFDDPKLAGLDDGASGDASATVKLIPCDEPHQFEAFDIIVLPDGDYPGDRTFRRAQRGCLPAFREYTGRAYAKSPLELYIYFPTRGSWEDLDDRNVSCILSDPRRDRVSRSFRQP